MKEDENELTIARAAVFLNMSQTYISKLLEGGEIAYHKVGTHRRIKLKDLERYKQKMEKDRRKHLEELAKQAQELDMGY